jgi:ribosomal protein S18 acetylase RimI-like enzyme
LPLRKARPSIVHLTAGGQVVEALAMGSNVAIRRIRADEANGLRDVRLAALAADPDAFGSTYERELGYDESVWVSWAREGAEGPDGAIFVAAGDPVPVGMVMVRLEAHDPSRAHVYGLWVEPGHRGKGLGAALTDATIAWARQRGAAEIALLVVATNDAAARLYRRIGFRDTGRTKTLGRDAGVVELEMARPLP